MFDMSDEYVIELIKDFEPDELFCNMKELMRQKELTLIKQVHQKSACFVIFGIIKMLVKNLNGTFVINVTMYC